MNIAIVDDEPVFLKQLHNRLREMKLPDCEIHEFTSGRELLSFYVKGMYEVIILDVEMPNLNGLQTAERIRQIDGSVIISFLTNYAEFAVQGYDVGVFRYILKNQPDYVYTKQLNSIIAECQQRFRTFTFNNKNLSFKFRLTDILYFEGHRRKVSLFTINGEVEYGGDVSYDIGLYDENDDLIIDLSVPNSTTEFVLPTEGLKEGIYYVVIKSTGFESYYLDKYSLYIDYQETDFYEKGNNNSYYTATVLTLGNRYYGVTDTGTNDVSDYYMIDIEKKGNYKFSLETEDQGNSSTFWNVIIDSINGERIADFSVKGNTTGNSLTQKFEKGKYIIVVESGSFNGPMSYDPYAVSVLKESDAKIVDKVKATKVKISSAKAGSKKITLACNKPSITGLKYEVQYKTGKEDWKTIIVDAKKYNGITISKLTSGKTYKVRARAYYLIGETGYTGPWSATKTVKVK